GGGGGGNGVTVGIATMSFASDTFAFGTSAAASPDGFMNGPTGCRWMQPRPHSRASPTAVQMNLVTGHLPELVGRLRRRRRSDRHRGGRLHVHVGGRPQRRPHPELRRP